MSKAKTKQEEALQLLDDLDSFTPIPDSTHIKGESSSNPPGTSNEGEAEVLAFIDEITQKSAEPTKHTAQIERPLSRAGTPTLRKSTERVKLGTSSLGTSTAARAATPPASSKSNSSTSGAPAPSTGGAWGWGSVWNTASVALQQARSVVDEQVKNLPNNEHAKKWGEGMIEYAKNAKIDKLGQDFKRVGLSTLTDILNVVAPPIAEHEVIQVWLIHNMKGYDGVESLVYRSMARVMEQVEGGDLVVNRGQPSQPKDEGNTVARDLNAVEGYEAAVKLAQANLDELIKTKRAEPVPQSSAQSPTSYSHVFLHVQPFLSSYIIPAASDTAIDVQSSAPPVQAKQQHLQFLIYLSDPSHNLIHLTITQAAPGAWLAIWDDYDWVEDLVAESLRVGVEVVAQEYVVSRMGWAKSTIGAELATEAEEKELKEEEQSKAEGS
ncbi:hypothetical protein E1B28_001332 [Marasmius oreades]|uniref:Maintenance of telomere capping protein 1 n=1 Tax=Marasmius oreades TaxID=181124 RepID=A0A9P7V380_9AGAR|nr:uncharacterized protein E1B28_001332 [Marasmius oreades]KAG7099485.1 hypothetical protein E1B28_001332 [Marasmius oreades]